MQVAILGGTPLSAAKGVVGSLQGRKVSGTFERKHAFKWMIWALEGSRHRAYTHGGMSINGNSARYSLHTPATQAYSLSIFLAQTICDRHNP